MSTMSRKTRRMSHLLFAAGLVSMIALIAAPAMAETYIITMTNGTTFESRYDPVEAPWDDDKILFLNEYGTRMTLPKADIEVVTSSTENSGFGLVIDSTTVDLGILLIDIPPPEEKDSTTIQQENFAQYLDAANAKYSVEQFVDPSQTGQGGLPAWGGTGGF